MKVALMGPITAVPRLEWQRGLIDQGQDELSRRSVCRDSRNVRER